MLNMTLSLITTTGKHTHRCHHKLIGVHLGFNFKDLGLLEKPVEHAYYDPHHSPPPVYINTYINTYIYIYI